MGNFLEPSLAKYIANRIQKKYDVNSDGMLSFAEFYAMSLNNKDYKFQRLLFRYCKYVVPQKQISIGINIPFYLFLGFTVEKCSVIFFHCGFFIPLQFSDATYDSSISFWPPPLAMISFSLAQAVVYSICLHSIE